MKEAAQGEALAGGCEASARAPWFSAPRLPRRLRKKLAPYADSWNAPAWLMCWLGWHNASRIVDGVCSCGCAPKSSQNVPADARKGAGGICGRHGLYDGLVCPTCRAEVSQSRSEK